MSYSVDYSLRMGKINRRYRNVACFADIFRYIKDGKYRVCFVIKKKELYDKIDMYEYINSLKKYFVFSYKELKDNFVFFMYTDNKVHMLTWLMLLRCQMKNEGYHDPTNNVDEVVDFYKIKSYGGVHDICNKGAKKTISEVLQIEMPMSHKINNRKQEWFKIWH